MCDESDQLNDLLGGIDFEWVDDNTAIGEFHGLPAAVSVLGTDPPAFAFQIRLNPGKDATAEEDVEMPSLSDSDISMSIENGSAWLTVYDLRPFESDDIQDGLETLAQSVLSSGLAREVVCLRCDRQGSAELMFVGGRPTRLCSQCLEDATREKDDQESELNASSFRATAGLPVLALVAACVWALFWLLVDILLDYRSIQVFEIHYFSMALILAILGAVGWIVGWPLGVTVRKSVAAQKTPRTSSILLVGTLSIVGEILYVGLLVFRELGVVDLIISAQLLVPVILDYSGFWILCKLILVTSIGFFGCIFAAEKKTVSMRI